MIHDKASEIRRSWCSPCFRPPAAACARLSPPFAQPMAPVHPKLTQVDHWESSGNPAHQRGIQHTFKTGVSLGLYIHVFKKHELFRFSYIK